MEFFLGLLSTVVFFILLFLASFIGYKLGKKKTDVKATPVSEEEQRKIEQFNNHFKALFAYDVSTAMKRKKV